VISSWITGTRFVSLPFSDHCEPLLSGPEQSDALVAWLRAECARQRCKYVELRPLSPNARYGQATESYWFHELSLAPSLDLIFRGCHKDSIQRSIRRAERERLSYETGRSDILLHEFYRLLLVTRRRHGLLPQPRTWFKNLLASIGDNLQIRVARKNGHPIAAMLTFRHRSTVVYKYGCSEERFHNLGGMPFLFWRLIEESKSLGAENIDFGRSDLSNEGLVTFKDRFGTAKRLLTYYRHPEHGGLRPPEWSWRAVRRLVSVLPDALLSTASRILYKQMG
jgi:hypothetical protein